MLPAKIAGGLADWREDTPKRAKSKLPGRFGTVSVMVQTAEYVKHRRFSKLMYAGRSLDVTAGWDDNGHKCFIAQSRCR